MPSLRDLNNRNRLVFGRRNEAVECRQRRGRKITFGDMREMDGAAS
jgi:hypothetical protein